MQVAETDGLAANMLTALLGHELVAGHATMMKLSAKIDRWLALVADDRLTEDQERGTREAVRLAIAASRLTERYRAGLLSLARLRGWDSGRPAGASAAASRRIDPADLLAAFGDDDDLDDGPDDGPGDGPKGGTRALVQALQQMRAVNSQLSAPLGNGHANGAKPNGAPMPNGAHTPSAPHANRGTLRHGQPLGRFPRRPALRRPHARGLPLPAARHGQRSLPPAWRQEHRRPHRGRARPRPRQPPGPRRPHGRDRRVAFRRRPPRPQPARPGSLGERRPTAIRAIHPMSSDAPASRPGLSPRRGID
jgi:hypothetical protein